MLISEPFYFNFTVFSCDLNKVQRVIEIIYENHIHKFELTEVSSLDKVDSAEFQNPESGGSHYPRFLIWENAKYLDKTFFVSNYQDGLSNLIHLTAKKANVDMFSITLSSGIEYPMFRFMKYSPNKPKRYVHLLKDDKKWEFYQSGEALGYERLENYHKKRLSDRISNEMILEYLKAEGVILEEALEKLQRGVLFERKEW